MLKYLIIILLITILFIFLLSRNNEIERFDSTKIPKIIVQTWKDENIPNKYLSDISSLKKFNPDYQFIFFTDDQIEKFILDNYPEYYQVYLRLPIKIQKIDFFRYVAIYHYGGFYFDLDMRATKNLDSLLDFDCIFPVDLFISDKQCENRKERYGYFCEKDMRFFVGQYAFAAKPKHPFIKKLIDNICDNIDIIVEEQDDSNLYVYQTTGPDYVTRMYMDYKDKNDILILEHEEGQQFGNYAVHNHYGTWK